jgi:uncharacterized membrane protein YfcA
MEFTTEFLIFASIVIFLSALVQATIGFGFPMIATPLLAMVTDMKITIEAKIKNSVVNSIINPKKRIYYILKIFNS